MIAALGRLAPGDPAIAFCSAVTGLGDKAILAAPVPRDDASRLLLLQLQASGVELATPARGASGDGMPAGIRPATDPAAGVRLLHLTLAALLEGSLGETARLWAAAVKASSGILSLDGSGYEKAPELPALRLEIRRLGPELLFVSKRLAERLDGELDALAKVPVVTLGTSGCRVFGRRVPAPAGSALEPDSFTAAFCVAYLEGATPLEAAGRAVLAAGPRSVTPAG